MFLKDSNIAIIAAASIFLPYIFTFIVLLCLTIYILINKSKREKIMIHDGSKIMMLFFAFAIIVPALYRNWIGVVVAIGVMFAMILGMFLRSIMTKPLFEKILTLICVLSLTGTSCAISEKFIIPLFDKTYYSHRASAAFFYPNYFGTIIGTVIIICAYKVLTRQGRKWFYYMIAGFNVVSMYLCESMFAWVEVFLGVAVLLVVLKMHRLLAIWLFTATVALFSIFVLNLDIIPRLSDAEVTTMMRLQIWQLALKQIIKSPLIGPGFMSFLYVYKDSKLGFLAPHAHSIYLDLLMNFGIIGTILFLWYFVCYYKSVIKIGIVEKKTSITSLIIAVTIVALVHGIIDVTLLWIQTLPLFLIILSGIGAYEKDIKTSNK